MAAVAGFEIDSSPNIDFRLSVDNSAGRTMTIIYVNDFTVTTEIPSLDRTWEPLQSYKYVDDWGDIADDVTVIDSASAIAADPGPRAAVMEFRREKAAFERGLPVLLQSHPNRYVAIHQGAVVDSDWSREKLLRRFFATYGDTHVYIGLVGRAAEVIDTATPFDF